MVSHILWIMPTMLLPPLSLVAIASSLFSFSAKRIVQKNAEPEEKKDQTNEENGIYGEDMH